MKGLLIKDMRILLRQKMTVLLIVLLGIFMSMNGGNASFSLGYMMVVSATLVISTISYDYFEKGMVFLFTLPVSRKEYVLEKYTLAFLVELLAVGFAMLIQVGSSFLGQQAAWDEFLVTGVVCLVVSMVLIALYIPVYIKCGPEKSRVAIFIVIGVIALVSYLIAQVEAFQGLLEKLVEVLNKMSAAQITGVGLLVWVLLMVASIGISIGIIEKKEF